MPLVAIIFLFALPLEVRGSSQCELSGSFTEIAVLTWPEA